MEKKEKNKKHDELVQKLPGLARDFDYGVGDRGLNIGNGSLDGLGFLLFFLFFFLERRTTKKRKKIRTGVLDGSRSTKECVPLRQFSILSCHTVNEYEYLYIC